MTTQKTYRNEEVLNKFCQVRFGGVLYECYNVTSLMHFVKCGKNDTPLKVNKSNALNLPKQTVLTLIKQGAAVIEVGSLHN